MATHINITVRNSMYLILIYLSISFSMTTCAICADDLSNYIDKYSKISFTDGSSYFTLFNDKRFELGPNGMSGRTIIGHWGRRNDGAIVIVGKWSWINGYSPVDDNRIMTMDLRTPLDPPNEKGISRPYFVIDEVRKISLDELLKLEIDLSNK